MTISAYTLLRDEELRWKTASVAARLGFMTEAGLHRYLIMKTFLDLEETDANIAAQEHQEDLAEEVEDLVLDGGLSSYQEAPASPLHFNLDEPPTTEIIEWLEDDDEEPELPPLGPWTTDNEESEEAPEPNPWLEEEEAIGPELLDLEDAAGDFAQEHPRATAGEALAFIARLMPLLLNHCPSEVYAEHLDNYQRWNTEPSLWPSLLVSVATFRRLSMLQERNE